MAILIVGRYFVDAIEYLADVQFRLVQRDDVTVGFQDVLPSARRYELAHLPGVLRAEPFRAVPVRLRFEHRSRRVGLAGLDAGSELHRLIDEQLRPVAVPPDGVLLTSKLAEVLGVHARRPAHRRGARRRRSRGARAVAGTVDELIGFNAYMDAPRAAPADARGGRRCRAPSWRSSRGQARASTASSSACRRWPGSPSARWRCAASRTRVARSMGIFVTVLVGFACVVAVAIVYNAARIALSERGRELASLRVLGFTRARGGGDAARRAGAADRCWRCPSAT